MLMRKSLSESIASGNRTTICDSQSKFGTFLTCSKPPADALFQLSCSWTTTLEGLSLEANAMPVGKSMIRVLWSELKSFAN